MQSPRILQLSGLALLAITGCHDGDEPEDVPEDIETRSGSLAPQEKNNLRLMRVDVDCNENDAFDPIDVYDMPLKTRMARLASIILANDPDVVMIHEARSDECRDALVSELHNEYPQYVRDIYYSNHDYADYPEYDFRPSSGMMLFSKFALDPFPDDRGDLFGTEVIMVEDEDGNDVPKIIDTPLFVEGSGFTESGRFVAARMIYHDTDTLSAVAVVRIRPKAGGLFHVMLTGGASWDSVAQKGDEMLWATLETNELTELPVFSLGEIGADGMEKQSGSDWHDAFHPAGGAPVPLMACGTDGLLPGTECTYVLTGEPLLTDSWGFAQPDTDLGQTEGIEGQTSIVSPDILTDDDGTRADYVLHSNPAGIRNYLCPQRMRRVFFADPDPSVQNFFPDEYESPQDGGYLPFGDDKVVARSFPLVVDYLFDRTERCMAKRSDELNSASYGSEVVSFASFPVQNLPVTLGDAKTGNRRHNAWFVIEDRATISIGALPGDAANFEVYHHSDLSTPISSWHGLEVSWNEKDRLVTGPVFDMADPPYYVRFEPSETATVPVTFTASFHKHGCTNPENDYCIVSNNGVPTVTSWPAGQQIIPYPSDGGVPAYADGQYFVAGVGYPDSKVHAKAVFTIESSDSSQFPDKNATVFPHCGFDVSLQDCGSGSCNAATKDTVLSGWSASAGGSVETLDTANDVTGNLSPANPGDVQPVLLRVRRECTPATCVASTMSVSFDANFYQLEPLSLTCLDEEDTGVEQDDEVFIQVGTDGAPVHDAAYCLSFNPGDPGSYTYLGRFDEHGESNKSKANFPGGWTGPWSLGAQTFVASTSVSLCESDVGSTSDNDFLGSAVHDMSATPLSPGETSQIFSETLTAASSKYKYRYRISAEDSALPPSCIP